MVGVGYVMYYLLLLLRISTESTDWEYAWEPELSSQVFGIVNYVSVSHS